MGWFKDSLVGQKRKGKYNNSNDHHHHQNGMYETSDAQDRCSPPTDHHHWSRIHWPTKPCWRKVSEMQTLMGDCAFSLAVEYPSGKGARGYRQTKVSYGFKEMLAEAEYRYRKCIRLAKPQWRILQDTVRDSSYSGPKGMRGSTDELCPHVKVIAKIILMLKLLIS